MGGPRDGLGTIRRSGTDLFSWGEVMASSIYALVAISILLMLGATDSAFASPAAAAGIAVDAVSRSSNETLVSSISWSHAVTATGTNVILMVGAVSRGVIDGNRPVVSITAN